MKETEFVFKKLKWFRLKKLPYYLRRITIYKKRHYFFKTSQLLRNQGAEYGALNVSGLTYFYNLNDITVPLEMFECGKSFAADEIELFFELIKSNYGYEKKEGLVFLDIGANIGTTSVYVSKKYGMEIISFEPSYDNYKMLEVNIRMNECLAVTTERVGISDKEDSAMMEINETNHGNNRIVEKKTVACGDKYELVKTVSIDEYLKERKIPYSRVGYIWMDIEGHEPYAIKGMKGVLGDHKIPIYMEFWNDRISNDNFIIMFEVLRQFYNTFYIVKEKLPPKRVDGIAKLKELYHGEEIHCDLFFC